ncbi:adenylate/guanylate cyclase domain-containing protein [Microvirga massiliensis]|uniref:adenylate/guanylate cyclase domain-containing protein n=1 Tax=Microvirga massiliensis TaxID=1033741 RepID=UPI00062BDD82|nr:adenylate/guanylate cyclase domain-containing protein [Microvirga massiliensis]
MQPARILIVDDEPFNLDVLEQELELLGHTSVRAENGREALDRLDDQPFDLVLLDVMMPQLDGFAVLGRIKSHDAWRHIPVVMISALTDISSVVRCIEMGAEDYLPKPFEPVLLEARIGACLQRKWLHDREQAHLEAIDRERKRADELLHAILPGLAVAELKSTGCVKPRLFADVAVVFVDLVGFTAWCHAHPPEEVVAEVQRLAEAFEDISHQHCMEKIKTIGDAFMATANLLRPHGDPVMAAVHCARDMATIARCDGGVWQVRAGIHIGSVVGGVVGRTKFTFDLWGDTVNVAARLSSLGSEGAILLSPDAFERVHDRCAVVAVGRVALKGKGELEVYQCAPQSPT